MAAPTLVPDPHADTDSLVEALVRRRFLGTHRDPEPASAAAEALVARLRKELSHFRVEVDGAVAGHVWLLAESGGLAVLDTVLAHATLAPAVLALIEDVAREAGLTRLSIGVEPGEPVAEAFAADPGFEVAGIQMRLPLDVAPPPEPDLELRPMTQARWDAWSVTMVADYADERVQAGEPRDVAERIAREQHAQLLPDGLATADHHFFDGVVDGVDVGILWLGTERPIAFVYDVAVDEAQRRRGHGARLMRAAAVWAHERGHHALGLNVFGYNTGARALYEGLGYDTVETFFTKQMP